MDTERYIVAVEIGSSKITGAIGTRSLKGVVTVLGSRYRTIDRECEARFRR